MVEPSAVWVEFDVRWWWWALAVHQVEWVTAEWIGGVEDATRVVGFPPGNAVKMVLPSFVGVECFRFAHVEN